MCIHVYLLPWVTIERSEKCHYETGQKYENTTSVLTTTQCSPNIEILSLSLISEEQGFSLPPEIKAPPQNEIKEVEIGKKTIRIQ